MRLTWIVALSVVAVANTALCAGPIEEIEPARQFEFWEGDWDVVNRFWSATDGEKFVPGARLRVYSILDGAAMVEHYRGQGRGGGDILGFSVRAYDPEQEKWVIILNWPSGNAPFWPMVGGFEFNRGLFFGETAQPDGKTRIDRYIFSDLLPGFYRWEGSASFDSKATWSKPNYAMEGGLRSVDAEPIDEAWLHGEDINNRCSEEHRSELDFLDGQWEGVGSILQRDGLWKEFVNAQVESSSILAGCARMNFYSHEGSDGGAYEAFTVFAFDNDRDAWVCYVVDGSGIFQRYEGKAADGEVQLSRQLEDGSLERFRWHDIGKKTFRWESAVSDDKGATWLVTVKSKFTRGN